MLLIEAWPRCVRLASTTSRSIHNRPGCIDIGRIRVTISMLYEEWRVGARIQGDVLLPSDPTWSAGDEAGCRVPRAPVGEATTLEKLVAASLNKIRSSTYHREPLTSLVNGNHDIWELRVGHSDIARLFFFFHARQEIVVTHGYVKKSQKTDPEQIERAIQCKRDWQQRFPLR